MHGADVKLTDLLVTLATCEKARSVGIHDRCKAIIRRAEAMRIMGGAARRVAGSLKLGRENIRTFERFSFQPKKRQLEA